MNESKVLGKTLKELVTDNTREKIKGFTFNEEDKELFQSIIDEILNPTKKEKVD